MGTIVQAQITEQETSGRPLQQQRQINKRPRTLTGPINVGY